MGISFTKLTNSGERKITDRTLEEKFILDILYQEGVPFSKHKNYQLWTLQRGKVKYWYIVQIYDSNKGAIVKEIPSSKYVDIMQDRIAQIRNENQLLKAKLEIKNKKHTSENQKSIFEFITKLEVQANE